MKIKVRNNIKKNFTGQQISFLPILDFYWNNQSCAIIIGWAIGTIEFWFGNTIDLV